MNRNEPTTKHKALEAIASGSFYYTETDHQRADQMIQTGISKQMKTIADKITKHIVKDDTIIFPFVGDVKKRDERFLEISRLMLRLNAAEKDPEQILKKIDRLIQHLKKDYRSIDPDDTVTKKAYKDMYRSLKETRQELAGWIDLSKKSEAIKHPEAVAEKSRELSHEVKEDTPAPRSPKKH